eukprot:g11388.t1
MAGPEASPRVSLTSSLESSHEFSVSRVLSNGNSGVVASVIWLVISAGLCFPWLLDQPSATKAGETPKSVAWFLVLALDLLIGTMSVFSLWFQRSTLSIILLIWGAGGILATFVMGSFAMLPAVATICCCAEEFCVLGAADTSPLDDSFCLAPVDLCMENKWALWCFFGGILLAMISVVLLVNSVALHHKTLLDCERRRNEAAKAIRAANRSRRRRQELWEQEVYGSCYGGSNAGMRASSHGRRDGPGGNTTTTTTTTPHPSNTQTPHNPAVAPSFGSPTRDHSHRPSRPVPADGLEPGRATPPGAFAPLDPRETAETDFEMSKLGSPTSAPPSQNGCAEAGGGFAIGAYTGGGAKLRDAGLEDDATRISSWGTSGPDTGAVMSWVAGEEDGGGRITPKTALRFKTSALSRAMHR